MNRCGECVNFIPTVIKRASLNGRCRLYYSSCTTENSRGCKNFSIKTITNADRIRAMSDDDLANWYCRGRDCAKCDHQKPDGCYMLDWLREPAAEVDHE